MAAWREDVRFAVRMLWRQKLLTLIAALTLALGMGMNTAIFSTVSGILWNTLPYPEAERLVAIWGENQKQGFNHASVSYRDAQDWQSMKSFDGLSVYQFQQVALSGSAEPRSVSAVEATAGFFDVIGEKAALGRTFDDSERAPGEHRVAVITEGLWRREFGGDPAAVGREMRMEGRAYTIIGIMPPGFSFLDSRADVFFPIRPTPERQTRRDWRGMRVLARLAPGQTIEQANAELQGIVKSLEQSEPVSNLGWGARVHPLELDVIDRGARLSIQTMFWAVMGVLLIACTNIASLLLARGTLRQRELAIRSSLGAGQGRIARLLLTESLVLSLLGGSSARRSPRGQFPSSRAWRPRIFRGWSSSSSIRRHWATRSCCAWPAG